MNASECGNIIREKLVGNGSIATLVNSAVRPMKAAKSDSYPYIIYEIISLPTLRSKDGNSNWYKARVQVSMLATSLASVKQLSQLCKTTLDDASGTIAGFTVQSISLEDERDIFNDNSAIDGVYMLQQDYFITFQI